MVKDKLQGATPMEQHRLTLWNRYCFLYPAQCVPRFSITLDVSLYSPLVSDATNPGQSGQNCAITV
jgi:hypothetical protein